MVIYNMILPYLSNRLVFVFSLSGLFVSAFLLYEYSLSGPIACPVGAGCDIVRASPYSNFLGISIPVLGVFYYLVMAILAVLHPQKILNNLLFRLKLVISASGVIFGMYLTYLEIFVIKAICFWCAISFIISTLVLLSVILERRSNNDNRN